MGSTNVYKELGRILKPTDYTPQYNKQKVNSHSKQRGKNLEAN